jgi:4-amino-4-deoxy-L-arabinose transferase-like glycosyltransferase
MRIKTATAWAVFAGGFLLRLIGLGLRPLNADEVYEALRGAGELKYVWHFPAACLDGIVLPLYPYLVSLAHALTPSPEWAVRIPAALAGGLTVVFLYHLGKELYGARTGLLAALLCSVLPWHVIQSRVGIPPVLAPLSGTLIFLTLMKAVRTKRTGWLLASFACAGIGAFYTYQCSVILAAVFCAALWLLRRELSWAGRKAFLAGALILLVFLSFPLRLQLSGAIHLFDNFYRFYQRDPFHGGFLANLLANIVHNGPEAFRALFFNAGGKILYAPSFGAPLLVHWITLPLLVWAAAMAVYRRSPADRLLLAWLAIGLAGGLAGIDVFAPRYIIIILPVLMVLLGRAFTFLFERASRPSPVLPAAVLLAGCCISAVPLAGAYQLAHYTAGAAADRDECIQNSYGCREAAEYLSLVPDRAGCVVIPDMRVTVDCYLGHYWPSPSRIESADAACVYYVLWAPESHPATYWKGQFSQRYEGFMQRYPGAKPVKVITYPDGTPAIDIFRVETAR